MPELEEDIRASAPRPREEFVAKLERRVEAGFGTPDRARRRRWRLRLPSLWGPGLALASTVLVMFVVVGVVVSLPNGADDSGGGGASSGSEAEFVSPQGTGEESALQAAPGRAPSTAPGDRRVVERTSTLDLRTPEDDFAAVTAGVLRVADSTGTVVQSSSVSERDGHGFATYDLRVPTSRLDEALAALSELADVRSRTAASNDVTAAYVSARDRIDDARAERRALLRSLERADSEAQRDAIRARLREARARIARAERDIRRVQQRVHRSRVAVTVESTGESGAWTPGDAIGDAGRVLEVMASVLLVAGAVLVPFAFLLVIAVVSGRIVRRRRRDAALG